MDCKGNFSTCEICNNAAYLLKDTSKRFSFIQREVIMQYRRLHLDHQAKERISLDQRKQEARKVDTFGQPGKFLLFGDAITASIGETPKLGSTRHSSSEKTAPHIQNRTMAFEVICGPIDTIFLYHLDAFVSAGANLMIELCRQAMLDLTYQLERLGLQRPRHGMFQFDNCGENKVYYEYSCFRSSPSSNASILTVEPIYVCIFQPPC